MKRALDFFFSFLGLLLLFPLFILIAVAICLDSRGPVFFRGERVGEKGNLFRIFKFRTMRVHSETSGLAITSRSDARVTRVGRFLRKTKLDELPQLFNVLLGQMSLVGPRPEDPRYVALYTPAQREILAFRPGITSPASVDYCNESLLFDGEDTERIYVERVLLRKLAIDLQYLRSATVVSDVGVIFRTVLSLMRNNKQPTGGVQ